MPQYTDTNVNQLVINKMTKVQYESITPSDTELYLVPDEIDSTPTSGSDNPVTSGGVYSALQDKLDAPSTAGTSGQVLTSDGQGSQSWQTPTSAVSDVTVGGISVVTNGVAAVPAYTIAKLGTPETGYFASYVLQKDGVQEGATINIPKDYLVKSGSVIDVVEYNSQYYDATDTTHTTPLPVSAAGKYLDFVVNTVDSSDTSLHIYIAVNDLVDAYTEGNGIDISNLNVVSIKIDSSNSNGLSVSSNGLALATVVASSGGTGGSSGAMTAQDKEKLNGLRKMVVLEYGVSTWSDFQNAFNDNAVVYCKASGNSNPATGTKSRYAFLAYIGNTNVEFQYYRSVSSHSDMQQGDQVYVYTLTNNSVWSVTVRESYTKIVAGTNLTSSYNSGTLTINAGAISDKLDKVNGATYHNFPRFDSLGDLEDSGFNNTSFANKVVVSDIEAMTTTQVQSFGVGDIVIQAGTSADNHNSKAYVVSRYQSTGGHVFLTRITDTEVEIVYYSNYQYNDTFVFSYASVANKADKVVYVDASTPPSTMDANKVYQYGTLSGDTTFPAFTTVQSGDTEVKIWCWTFTTPGTAPTITWPAGITAWNGGPAPTINASKNYEVSVMDGVACIIETDIPT